jgi:hypothetical protein
MHDDSFIFRIYDPVFPHTIGSVFHIFSREIAVSGGWRINFDDQVRSAPDLVILYYAPVTYDNDIRLQYSLLILLNVDVKRGRERNAAAAFAVCKSFLVAGSDFCERNIGS